MSLMLYEGKAKKIFATEKPDEVIIYYKDDATAFNGLKKGTIANKGIINNKLTEFFFRLLEKSGVKTHLLQRLSDRELLCRKVAILPIEVVVRNIAAGSIAKRLGLPEGEPLAETVVELYYKNDDLGDPLINYYHIKTLGIATPEQVAALEKAALAVNRTLSEHLLSKGIKLVDFKLEFGLFNGEILLADEITPDTCRRWDAATDEKLDKDRFRRDLGKVEDAYHEVLYRLTGARE
jgi:phosphoribosylaminoimidazole-succinocarboxamide synthase